MYFDRLKLPRTGCQVRVSQMIRYRRVLVILIILLVCVGCDQVTKVVARDNLRGYSSHSYFFDTFRFHYAENTGGFLSLGSELPEGIKFWLMRIFPTIALLGMLAFTIFSTKLTRFESLMMALLIGGGISNMIDRLFNDGRVIDFMNMGIGPLRTGIFNVADVLIMTGAIGLVLMSLIRRPVNRNQ